MSSRRRSPDAVRQQPSRTCVACQQVKPRHQLVRLVRIPEGQVEIDADGIKAGRGAYLCPRPECWVKGLKGNRLEYVLHTSLTTADRERLTRYYQECISGQSG